MEYIANKSGEIRLPYSAELLTWLQTRYPFSQYRHVVELIN